MLSWGDFSDVPIERNITKVSWKYIFTLRVTGCIGSIQALKWRNRKPIVKLCNVGSSAAFFSSGPVLGPWEWRVQVHVFPFWTSASQTASAVPHQLISCWVELRLFHVVFACFWSALSRQPWHLTPAVSQKLFSSVLCILLLLSLLLLLFIAEFARFSEGCLFLVAHFGKITEVSLPLQKIEFQHTVVYLSCTGSCNPVNQT